MARVNDNKLIEIGFIQDPLVKEENLNFQVYSFAKDDSYISVVNEFTSGNVFKKQFTSINDREMPKNYSSEDLQLLIKAMFN